MEKVGRYIPNILTAARGIGAIVLIFLQVLSVPFLIVYIICGISDMLDGPIARKWHGESKFGERFDSICDLLFTVVCLIKILPCMDIPIWTWIWIGCIVCLKVINLISGLVCHHHIIFLHTKANKLTGLLLFLVPCALVFFEIKFIAIVLCPVAAFAAIQEGHFIRAGNHQN